jgi:small-conductance mechanosensitive channel
VRPVRGASLVAVFAIVLSIFAPWRAWAADASVDAAWAAADGAIEAGDAGVDDAADAALVEDAGTDAADVSVEPAATTASADASATTPVAIVEGSPVKLRDKKVFVIRVPLAGVSAEERARRASAALERVVSEAEEDEVDVRIEDQQAVLVVIAGKTPVVQLAEADAIAAGDASLQVHAAAVAASVRSAIKSERTRSAVAQTVFSWSLVVFTALVAFLGLRRARDIALKGRTWIDKNPKRLPALRIGAVEILRPAAFQGLLKVTISLLERALQLSVAYVWLVFSLSLFESTRDVGKRVTGAVLNPVGALAGRLALSLPILVVSLVGVLALGLLLRFIGLFFGSVARGETTLSWLPRDLAGPTGVVVRVGLVAAAVLLGGPLVTGSDEGTGGRAGLVLLAALGLACVPVMATGLVGMSIVFGRRLRVGEFVSIDGRQGRVANLSLLEVVIHDGEGAEYRVPYLALVTRPFRVLGPSPLAIVDVVVDPKHDQARVREVLAQASESTLGPPRVRLLSIDADGARYEIVARRAPEEQDVAARVVLALAAEGIALGRTQGFAR